MTTKKTARTVSSSARGGGGDGQQFHSHHTPAHAAAQPVFSATGQTIGQVSGTVFSKRVRGSVHQLRAPRGWALDAATLEDLRALHVVTVAVTDVETGTCYTALLAEFGEHGVPFNRGFGPQVALPLGYWSVDGQPPALAPRQPDPNAARQLSLFSEGVS
ncbi:MAG: hypothetical protein M5U29_04260 [Anaerolineae bacterium]|nr:hypothetical protein [Anaerolineae bacterium]